MRAPLDPDATVVLRRQPAPGRRRGRLLAALAGLALLAGAGLAALLLWQRGEVPPLPVAQAPAEALPAARVASPLAILANSAETLTVFRLDVNPRIFVLDVPTLTQQGLMLNRVAALVEKAGLPRDRVLDDDALATAIASRGETLETFYFGHNYRARDLVRFFGLAAAQGVALNAEERRLAALLVAVGVARAAGGEGLVLAEDAAFVTVPGLQPADPARGVTFAIDAGVREAILRHELSHGEFFTNPAFAAHVAAWWRERLSPHERARIRRFLEEGGYDPSLEEVMMNEAMAYLIHTPDPRFFSPEAAGLDVETVARLRASFAEGLPKSWLDSIAWPSGR